MNLEEIKKKVVRYQEFQRLTENGFDIEDFSEDVIYILSIIEQAQGGFEEIQLATKYLQHVPIMGLVYNLADEALKAIRGN